MKLSRKTILKALVTSTLIAWLTWTLFDKGAQLPPFETLHWRWLGVTLLLHLLAVGVGSLRWWVLLRGQELQLSLRQCARAFLVGRFFGAFTPSTLGLDGYRFAESARISGDAARSASVIAAEKVAGVTGMALISLLSLLEYSATPAAKIPLGVALGLLVSAGVAVLHWPSLVLVPLVTLVQRLPGGTRVAEATKRFQSKLTPLRWGDLAAAVGLGATTHLALATTFASAAKSLQVSAEFGAMIGCGNLIQLGVLAPISLGGVGVREGVAVAAFGQLGVPAGIGVLISIASYLIGQTPAIIGGLIHLFVSRETKT